MKDNAITPGQMLTSTMPLAGYASRGDSDAAMFLKPGLPFLVIAVTARKKTTPNGGAPGVFGLGHDSEGGGCRLVWIYGSMMLDYMVAQ